MAYCAWRNRTQSKSPPRDSLRRFSFHTGASLRVLDPDEPCPVLFRDLGLVGMQLFLSGQLIRLAGPLSPITYMRTAEYQEPYEDYDRIGRLVLLQPAALRPWHSGIASVYVAPRDIMPPAHTMGIVPASGDLTSTSKLLADVKNSDEMRECFGNKTYDDFLEHTRTLVSMLLQEMFEVERFAEPLRRSLKSLSPAEVDWARESMVRHSISQADLCCAWNHVPTERRAHFATAVRMIGSTNVRC